MAEDTIHIIMAHGSAQETFQRHLPVWERNGLPITVVCPSDNPVQTNHALTKIGTRQHHGVAAIERFIKIIDLGVRSGFPYILFDEYDSMAFELPFHLKTTPGLHGFVWTDGNPANGFVGKHFIHPPLFMDNDTASGIIEAAIKLASLGTEQGFWDRWIGMICEKGNIPFHTTEKHHFSRNTIEQGHIGLLSEALTNGATWFHGVKSEPVFNMIKARYA